jgi:hypothetical protein
MTTTTSTMSSGSAEHMPVAETLFTDAERTALVGFLAGYGGLTRDAYTLDLRQYTSWCTQHGLPFTPGEAPLLMDRGGGGGGRTFEMDHLADAHATAR